MQSILRVEGISRVPPALCKLIHNLGVSSPGSVYTCICVSWSSPLQILPLGLGWMQSQLSHSSASSSCLALVGHEPDACACAG